jgi:hypothetical protein
MPLENTLTSLGRPMSARASRTGPIHEALTA